MAGALQGIRVIDTDTHIIEPYDLWTSRIPAKKWGDRVPQVRWDEAHAEEAWFSGGERIATAAGQAQAGWITHPPFRPTQWAQIARDTWALDARLARMDADGIWAQVLYPNVFGFGSGRYLGMKDGALMLECLRAYNDFVTEWASGAPERFACITALPIWDVEAAKAEMRRCEAKGHRGVILSSQPEDWGLPHITDRAWDPLWAEAQALGQSINFHIGSGNVTRMVAAGMSLANGPHANFANVSLGAHLENARALSNLVCGGICHRFPRLNFVSVESGVGWLPFALESMDWMWQNSGVPKEHPEYDLLPSEYFRRQIYGCFWFERASVKAAVEQIGADNLMFETDFPHPTSLSPGPASVAVDPRQHIEDGIGDLPRTVLEKLLHDNAARIYRLN